MSYELMNYFVDDDSAYDFLPGHFLKYIIDYHLTFTFVVVITIVMMIGTAGSGHDCQPDLGELPPEPPLGDHQSLPGPAQVEAALASPVDVAGFFRKCV